MILISSNGNRDHQSISRITRFAEPSLFVDMKTFGTEFNLTCKVVNTSISGLLISPYKKNLPFQVKTLLEIMVPVEKNIDVVENIFFLGKVVRIESPKVKITEAKYGIQIVDIEEPDLNLWKERIQVLGKNKEEEQEKIAVNQ